MGKGTGSHEIEASRRRRALGRWGRRILFPFDGDVVLAELASTEPPKGFAASSRDPDETRDAWEYLQGVLRPTMAAVDDLGVRLGVRNVARHGVTAVLLIASVTTTALVFLSADQKTWTQVAATSSAVAAIFKSWGRGRMHAQLYDVAHALHRSLSEALERWKAHYPGTDNSVNVALKIGDHVASESKPHLRRLAAVEAQGLRADDALGPGNSEDGS